jgi:hypothetical protein
VLAAGLALAFLGRRRADASAPRTTPCKAAERHTDWEEVMRVSCRWPRSGCDDAGLPGESSGHGWEVVGSLMAAIIENGVLPASSGTNWLVWARQASTAAPIALTPPVPT